MQPQDPRPCLTVQYRLAQSVSAPMTGAWRCHRPACVLLAHVAGWNWTTRFNYQWVTSLGVHCSRLTELALSPAFIQGALVERLRDRQLDRKRVKDLVAVPI